MGNTWSVDVWGWHFGERRYSDLRVYGGESMWGAIRAVWQNRKAGWGCITIKWHPRSATGES